MDDELSRVRCAGEAGEPCVDNCRRSDALLAGEKHLLEMVASGHPLPVVLQALCRLVEESERGYLCSILLVDPRAAVFQHGAAPSLPQAYYASKAGRPVHPESGPCGLAASAKRQAIVPDVSAETRWNTSGWCAFTMSHGLRSCWSSPILSRAQEALGTFAIYRREPGAPTSAEQDLIARLTHFASIAIERARSDAALRRSESFLAEAQSLSRTGSFSWRMGTDEMSLSEEVYRILELDAKVPVTLATIAELIHPDGIHSLADLVASVHTDGRTFECEHRLLLSDGSVRYLHLVAHATRDHQGQLEYIGAIQDVTQRRLSEEALGRARAELAHVARVTSLGALTASIAHEVNQPLSGIITNASTGLRMLASDPPNVEGARETLRRTIRDGHRAAEVIARLRALFSRKEPASEPVDLNEATREVVALMLSELQGHRIVLRMELAEDLPVVIGDRVQLQQVVLNLLLNASEAMSDIDDRPRELVVRSGLDGSDRVRLDVQDAGTGISPESVTRVFDAFYTTKSGGMGIGLSVSRSIIESHHGQLVAAPNDGPGVTFSFSIPHGGGVVMRRYEHPAGRATAMTGAA
ncbi:MAG: multi-sensor signal transduction histidine kinase [Geminicoccaceae bacterium]|nr:multi-sensor signal transduction histidine kinase [Geminicoccaceae bacterium]